MRMVLYRGALLGMIETLRGRGLLPDGLAVTAHAGRGIGEQRADLKAWVSAPEPDSVGTVSPYLTRPLRDLADVRPRPHR